jgi:hypothetical protein
MRELVSTGPAECIVHVHSIDISLNPQRTVKSVRQQDENTHYARINDNAISVREEMTRYDVNGNPTDTLIQTSQLSRNGPFVQPKSIGAGFSIFDRVNDNPRAPSPF